jgi:hypothetical protein
MSELYPTTTDINALSGTSDSEQEVLYPAIAESPYYTSFYKMLYRLLDLARRAGDLRVYKDGDLTFGVRAGSIAVGDTVTTYAGASGQALTDDATNYIYLTGAGVLTVNTTGFPAPSAAAHVRLATVATGTASEAGASGSYDFVDITDCRGSALASVLGAGWVNDGDVTDAKLSSTLQEAIPQLSISASAEGATTADTIDVTLQVQDASGASLAKPHLLRVWIDDAEFGAPDATGNTVTVSTGTTLQTLTANADYELLTDANGAAQMDIAVSGAASRYVMAELDGVVYSSGELVWV